MLTALLIIVMLACIAMAWNEGLWGNAITLINVLLAGLIATNYFEPLAGMIEGAMPSYTYMWDFIAIWMIFAITFGIMRAISDRISRTKVRFKAPVEYAGRVLLAFAIGYAMMAFTCMTLHTAPLPERAFGGAFHRATHAQGLTLLHDKNMPNHFLGMLAPDRQWLAFVHNASAPGGSLSRWAVFGWEKRQFDPEGRFVFKYGARRRALQRYNSEEGAIRVRTN